MSTLNRTLLSLNVSESDKGKQYWATRSWSTGNTVENVRVADLLIVPWENFREASDALFPSGTTDFIAAIRSSNIGVVEVAIDREKYFEIALHANEWRLPTLLCTTVILPLLLNVLASHVDQWLFSRPSTTIVEQELIIESGNQNCISIRYKGPPSDLVSTFRDQAAACFPKSINALKLPGASVHPGQEDDNAK